MFGETRISRVIGLGNTRYWETEWETHITVTLVAFLPMSIHDPFFFLRSHSNSFTRLFSVQVLDTH